MKYSTVYRPDEVLRSQGSRVIARRDKPELAKQIFVTSAFRNSFPVRVGHHVRMCRYLSYDVGRHPSQYHLLPLRTGGRDLSSRCKYIHIQKTDMCDVFQLRLDPGMGQILSDGTEHCSQLWSVLLCAGSNTNQSTGAAQNETAGGKGSPYQVFVIVWHPKRYQAQWWR